MPGSLNRVELIGHLGRDPEIRTFQDGGKVATLSVATSERWKDGAGEQKERTEWNRVVVHEERLVKLAEQYLKKGSFVRLVGQLETRKFDKDGETRYATEVTMRPFRSELTFLEGGRESEPKADPEPGRPPSSSSPSPRQTTPKAGR